MKNLIRIFLLSLPFGQLGAIAIAPTVIVYVHDVILSFLVFFNGITLKKSFFAIGRLRLALVLFCMIALFSLFVNAFEFSFHQVFLSSLYLIRFILYASLYFIVLRNNFRFDFWLMGLYGSGIIFGLFGLIQYILYPTLRNLFYLGWDEHFYRLFSTFFDPNFAGIYIVLTFYLGIYLYKSVLQKRLVLFLQAFLVLTLLLTYSRSSFLSFIFGMFLMFFLSSRLRVGLVFVIVFFLFIVLLPTWGRDVLEISRRNSIVARLGNWQQSIALATEKPLFGFGFNTLRIVQIERGWASDYPYVSRSASGVDNSLLFVLVTTGLVGLLSYINLIVNKFYVGFFIFRRQKLRFLGLIYIVSLTSLLVHSMFMNSLFYPWTMIWLWIFTGVIEKSFTSDR